MISSITLTFSQYNKRCSEKHHLDPQACKLLERTGQEKSYFAPETYHLLPISDEAKGNRANLPAGNLLQMPQLNKQSSGSWVSLGPEGGWIYNLVMHPTDHNILYAQTYTYPTRIYKSTNGGESWELQSYIPEYIYAIAIDPNNPSILFAGTRYMHKSVDSGKSWKDYQITTQSFYIMGVHVCPTNSNLVYAGGYYYGADRTIMAVAKSTDGGLNWTLYDASPAGWQGGYTYSCAVNPQNPGELYLGGEYYDGATYNPALLKSTDGGVNWTNMSSNITGYAYCIAIDPIAPNKVYVGSYTGIFRSNNAGTSWSKNNGSAAGYRMAIDPQNSNIIYAGYGDYLCKSTDGGINWTLYRGGLCGSCYALLVDHTTTNRIYFGSSAGLFLSSNSGTDWSGANPGIVASTITSIGISPSDPQTIYIEFDANAVFKSTNSGNNWTRLPEFLACGNIGAIAVDPTSNRVVYALEGSG